MDVMVDLMVMDMATTKVVVAKKGGNYVSNF
nr:MAG TPA: hypothetical protein [Caudoviricetes sp.]